MYSYFLQILLTAYTPDLSMAKSAHEKWQPGEKGIYGLYLSIPDLKGFVGHKGITYAVESPV